MIKILSILRDLFTGTKNSDYQYRVALDIGTEFVKALIVRFNNDEVREIIGFGKVKQDYSNMEGGAISDIEEVIKRCYEAIEEAKAMAEVEVNEVVIGIAGEFVKGVVNKVSKKRTISTKRLQRKEIDNLVHQVQEESLTTAKKKLLADIGLENIKVELVNSSVVEIKIDGYKVSNPEKFQGKNLEVTVFNTFAPLVHVSALETIATRLGYRLAGIIAEPFAIAKSIMSNEAYEFGAIVIDIGGGTTDIALVRNGGIEGTKMFSLAGRNFTKSLARHFNISLTQAEDLKLKYSQGKVKEGRDQIDTTLKNDIKLLAEGIEVALSKLANSEALPQKIYLCGGGSSLANLKEGIKERELYEELPFFKTPEINLLTASDIKGIEDRVNLKDSTENVTPKSLALQAAMVQSSHEGNFLEKLVSNFV
ncbi:cell division FtsA domain-containing protein [Halanaerobacter jeridensis]|uniref:Cell division protein FtsA n=1 Tax=Halanaerobacter jeridensis TaxID=706427 RepID=A0A939BMC3_9FIRM|nr:cell division protein FtsA [Halanaerobacter jeridensis]